MTPQQRAHWGPPRDGEELAHSSSIAAPQRHLQKMKPIVHRRRSTSTALSRALSKSKHHPSARDVGLCPAPPDNGLSAAGAFARPNSLFLLDERVQMTQGLQTQERHLFLFDDRLVVAKSKSSSSLKLKKQVPLGEIWTSAGLGNVSEKRLSPAASFVLGWPTTNCVVTFSSPEVKEKWLSTLRWHAEAARQAESPKSLPMQVFLTDGENSSSSISVPVSNMEVVDDVIKKAAQQLGLPGRASDYRLCVLSGRDSPAFPLLGHEYPLSIILSSLRGSFDHVRGTNNNDNLLPGCEAAVLDQIPKERQCRFILKPRPNAHVPLRREPLQKPGKRKKSLIDWALRRSSSTPNSSPASQSPPNPRKLFGLSLSSVCPGGSLPKPIMDILQLLYLEGPSTRGIFRRSANAKTCKELKERLNSGDDVQVDGESVFVAAAVITDFLRNIPDSVLSSDMHGLWMEAMDQENWEHRIEAIQSLVSRLPEANQILLRHLFGVLQRIEQNAAENQMTALNLALCIAPNMLWPPSPTGPEEESKSTKKVAFLVQFLIENSAEIFGRDITSLFQRPERKKSKSVDDILARRTDSSDEMEFSASFGERSERRYGPDAEDGFLNPEREDWDLFGEIAACYRSKVGQDASADSYDFLGQEEEGGSFCSLGSVRSLDPARNRCSSEPSVCLPPRDHAPVARQSSCDAAIMRSHGDYLRRLQRLQLESQKLLHEGLSRSTRPGFWRTSPGGHLTTRLVPPKASPSNRSSFSSLSSTTSPSASSLSSLDSAFSYCSESSSTFSPTTDHVSSLLFMFGTSARLQVTKRSSKEWHKPLTSPLPLGDVEFSFDGREEDVTVFLPVGGISGSLENLKRKGEEEESRVGTLSYPLANDVEFSFDGREDDVMVFLPIGGISGSLENLKRKGEKEESLLNSSSTLPHGDVKISFNDREDDMTVFLPVGGLSGSLENLKRKGEEEESRVGTLSYPLANDVEFSFDGREEDVTVFLPVGGISGSLENLKSKGEKEESHVETFSYPLENSSSTLPHGDVKISFNDREDDVTVFLPVGGISGSLENLKRKGEEVESHVETLSYPLASSSRVKTEYRTTIPSPESSFTTSKDAPFSQGSLKRTKITVYMSPRESPVAPDEGYVVTDPGGTQTVRVCIPQTVFYGQNTPLVLQSVSRRYHHESSSPPTRVEDVVSSQAVSKTFSHTFRIFLPASVRHTVREYFSRDGPEERRDASVETVEGELLRSRVEWPRSESRETLMFAEETFV